jgi:hypothetical protein
MIGLGVAHGRDAQEPIAEPKAGREQVRLAAAERDPGRGRGVEPQRALVPVALLADHHVAAHERQIEHRGRGRRRGCRRWRR